MNRPIVKFVKIHPDAKLPTYKTKGAAGADVYAVITTDEDTVTVKAGKRLMVETGLLIELPPGYECQVRPRSGLALKNGITVMNTPGTIDEDYRGKVGVVLFNSSDEDFSISAGDRIAQIVIKPVVQGVFHEVEELSSSDRGERGFGSTGVKKAA